MMPPQPIRARRMGVCMRPPVGSTGSSRVCWCPWALSHRSFRGSGRRRDWISCCTGPGWKVAWPHMKHRNHCQIKPKVKCQ